MNDDNTSDGLPPGWRMIFKHPGQPLYINEANGILVLDRPSWSSMAHPLSLDEFNTLKMNDPRVYSACVELSISTPLEILQAYLTRQPSLTLPTYSTQMIEPQITPMPTHETTLKYDSITTMGVGLSKQQSKQHAAQHFLCQQHQSQGVTYYHELIAQYIPKAKAKRVSTHSQTRSRSPKPDAKPKRSSRLLQRDKETKDSGRGTPHQSDRQPRQSSRPLQSVNDTNGSGSGDAESTRGVSVSWSPGESEPRRPQRDSKKKPGRGTPRPSDPKPRTRSRSVSNDKETKGSASEGDGMSTVGGGVDESRDELAFLASDRPAESNRQRQRGSRAKRSLSWRAGGSTNMRVDAGVQTDSSNNEFGEAIFSVVQSFHPELVGGNYPAADGRVEAKSPYGWRGIPHQLYSPHSHNTFVVHPIHVHGSLVYNASAPPSNDSDAPRRMMPQEHNVMANESHELALDSVRSVRPPLKSKRPSYEEE